MSKVPHSLHYVRPVTVAFVRKRGRLADAAAAAWSELRDVLRRDAREAETGFGLIYQTGDHGDEIAFDACAELPAISEGNDGTVATQAIRGGVHIAAAPVDGHASLDAAIAALLADPMIGQGLSLDLDQPAIVTYARAGCARLGETRWQLTLSVPLSWAETHQGQAA